MPTTDSQDDVIRREIKKARQAERQRERDSEIARIYQQEIHRRFARRVNHNVNYDTARYKYEL
jgi:hypothetical protein